jgi:hypothetical protein
MTESELSVSIYQIVRSAVLHITQDKTVAETFCANLSEYVFTNAEQFVNQYGEISRDSVTNWLTELN